MDERLLTEAFSKIKKQYNSIQSMIDTSDKPDRTNLSIELYNNTDTKPNTMVDTDKVADQKQRMLMRVKHIERYMKFIDSHIQKVTSMIADIPPYNVALEIQMTLMKLVRNRLGHITEEVYSTLNIGSDEKRIRRIKPDDLLDDTIIRDEVESDKE